MDHRAGQRKTQAAVSGCLRILTSRSASVLLPLRLPTSWAQVWATLPQSALIMEQDLPSPGKRAPIPLRVRLDFFLVWPGGREHLRRGTDLGACTRSSDRNFGFDINTRVYSIVLLVLH